MFPLMFVVIVAIIMAMVGMVQMGPALETMEAALPHEMEPQALSDDQIEVLLANVTIDTTYSHAELEHPDSFLAVRECLAKKGPYMQFQIEPKKRYLRVCIIDEELGIIGFQIVDICKGEAKELTAYIKESIKTIKQLLKYIDRMGYCRFRGCL